MRRPITWCRSSRAKRRRPSTCSRASSRRRDGVVLRSGRGSSDVGLRAAGGLDFSQAGEFAQSVFQGQAKPVPGSAKPADDAAAAGVQGWQSADRSANRADRLSEDHADARTKGATSTPFPSSRPYRCNFSRQARMQASPIRCWPTCREADSSRSPHLAPQPQKTPATVQGGNQPGSIVDVVTREDPAGTSRPYDRAHCASDRHRSECTAHGGPAGSRQWLGAALCSSPRAAARGVAAGSTGASAAAPASQPANARVDSRVFGVSAVCRQCVAGAGDACAAAPSLQQQTPAPRSAAAAAASRPSAYSRRHKRSRSPLHVRSAQQQSAPQQQPLVPQVPLPQGYTDPQQAISRTQSRGVADRAQQARSGGDAAELGDTDRGVDTARSKSARERRCSIRQAGQPALTRARRQIRERSRCKALSRRKPVCDTGANSGIQSSRPRWGAIRQSACICKNIFRENPDATADDVKRAAQLYTTQTTAQNRFLSGPARATPSARSMSWCRAIQTMQDLGEVMRSITATSRPLQRCRPDGGPKRPAIRHPRISTRQSRSSAPK